MGSRTESYTVSLGGGAAASADKEFRPGGEGAESKRLLKMALVTGSAIFLHNFPEGLATFIAAAEDPTVGASLAIAIGVHNIPEGVCVAVPIYFATGSKLRGFLWASASGLAEPVAGAIGWIALSQSGDGEGDIGALAYGLLFSIVAGMMVYICISELLPAAYLTPGVAPEVVMRATVVGMAVMAASLMIFVA